MTELSIEPFAHVHLDGLVALVLAEGWSEYRLTSSGLLAR
jgi:hypothetical protein